LEFPPGIADAMRTASYKLLETKVNGRRSMLAEQRYGGSGIAQVWNLFPNMRNGDALLPK